MYSVELVEVSKCQSVGVSGSVEVSECRSVETLRVAHHETHLREFEREVCQTGEIDLTLILH